MQLVGHDEGIVGKAPSLRDRRYKDPALAITKSSPNEQRRVIRAIGRPGSHIEQIIPKRPGIIAAPFKNRAVHRPWVVRLLLPKIDPIIRVPGIHQNPGGNTDGIAMVRLKTLARIHRINPVSATRRNSLNVRLGQPSCEKFKIRIVMAR